MATSQQSIKGKVGINQADLKRIASAAGKVEKAKASGSRPIYDRARWTSNPGMASVRSGVVSTTITARSGDTPGAGKVTFLVPDGSVSTDPSDVVDVLNDYGATFGASSSKRCKIHYEFGGWRLLTREC